MRSQFWERLLKFIHLIAIIAFIGGILGCIVLRAGCYLHDPEKYVFRRLFAFDLSMYLIIPGMVGTVVSGICLSIFERYRTINAKWIFLKQFLGAIILLNGFALVLPKLLEITTVVRLNQPNFKRLAHLQYTEDILGGINLLFAITAIITVIWKPQLIKN